MAEVIVVTVPPAETWPCGQCGADVVAYVATNDAEETHGYCRDCLAGAILAEDPAFCF